MQPCNRIYYSVYWRLNMFRTARRSSSEALNCICSLWFTYTCGDRVCQGWVSLSLGNSICSLWFTYTCGDRVCQGWVSLSLGNCICSLWFIYTCGDRVCQGWVSLSIGNCICSLWFIYTCGDRPLSRLYDGQSPHAYVNQRLQIQFRAAADEWYAARNMLSLQ